MTKLLDEYGGTIDPSVATLAILTAQDMQITFTSRFGEPSHLATQGDYVFLVPVEYTAQRTPHTLEDAYYRANLISTTTTSLREWRIASTIVEGAGEAAVAGQAADVDAHMRVIEETLLSSGAPSTAAERLLKEYQHYIFHFQEPTKQLAEYKRSKEDPKHKQGRRPNVEKVEYLRSILDPRRPTASPCMSTRSSRSRARRSPSTRRRAS